MKNTLKTLIVGLGFAALVGCQQVNPVNNQPFASEEPTGNDLTCPGTDNLNCFVDFPANGQTIDSFNFSQSYVACMDTCLPSNCTDSGGDIVDEAADECPSQYAACDEQCSMTSEEGPLSGLPPSDGLSLPENPKAVLVEMTGCFDSGAMNEIHIQGPEINVVTPLEGYRSVIRTGFLGLGGKKVRLGYLTGHNSRCPAAYKNKMHIKYIPVGDTTVTVGSHEITVVPFANTSAVTKDRALPATMPSGLPASIRDELDLSEVVSIPKEFGATAPGSMHAINDWRFYNNDVSYGQSVLFAGYYGFSSGGVVQTIKFYMFAKAKD